MASKKWQNNVMSIQDSKNGNLYIRVNEDISLKKGQNLVLKDKQEALDESLKDGRITVERHAELSDKLNFIKYEISVPPNEE